MKPYGMTVKEYSNDSKRAGDLKCRFDGKERRSTNRLEQKKALRRYKKTARQNAKNEIGTYLSEA